MNHLELDLTVDFDSHRIHGRAIHHLEEHERAGGTVELHTRGLQIEKVQAEVDGNWAEAAYALADEDPVEGRMLAIEVPAGASRVAVDYRNLPEAEGLQWLDPDQTAGGKQPFLYSQGQSTHNRTWIPCFDDPSKRITFDAVLHVPPHLRAVMAAEDRSRPEEADRGIYRFHMPQPVPSYLIAMAVGDLVFRELGPRTGVWTEPSVLDLAARELEDTEKMVEAVEAMFGEYRWGRYDVLVLPPSFPLGGMENPRLTFATPTILAGDKSLVALIAHELAHSWSGNLVTNHTWNDFWLNEGFTVYLERRIQEELYGRQRSEMEAMLGRSHLDETIAELGADSRDTWLEGDLAGRHPDEAMTLVPYEKGYLLLRLIEETYGREAFDRFLRAYFDRHAFETMTTARFLDELEQELLSADPAKAASLRIEEWVHGPGVPDNAPVAESDAFDRVEAAAGAFLENGELPREGGTRWTAHEWIHFLRQLPADLPTEAMGRLDEAFSLTDSHNSEILTEWLLLSIRTGYEAADARLESFLATVGRRKFVKPLFEELVRRPGGLERAKQIYARTRRTYHAMTSSTVDEILGL